MKTYYFTAKTNDGESFICSFQNELKPNDWIIVYLGYEYGFTVSRIFKQIDELKALTSDEEIIEVVCHSLEISQYEVKMKKTVEALKLRDKLESMNKDVALMEKCRKNASIDPKYAEVYRAYQQLMDDTTYTTGTPDTDISKFD